jgi:hypothetical protein
LLSLLQPTALPPAADEESGGRSSGVMVVSAEAAATPDKVVADVEAYLPKVKCLMIVLFVPRMP